MRVPLFLDPLERAPFAKHVSTSRAFKGVLEQVVAYPALIVLVNVLEGLGQLGQKLLLVFPNH